MKSKKYISNKLFPINFYICFKRLTAYLLVVFLLLTPILQVFAQEVINKDTNENSIIENNNKVIEKTSNTTNNSTDNVSLDKNTEDTTKEVVPNNQIEQTLSSNSISSQPEYLNVNNKQKSTEKSEINKINGSLSYSYPIDIPLGRNGMNPEINLSYNSSTKENDSIFGYGWNVSIPYIETVNKKGSENIYTNNDLTSSLDGDLVEISGGVYGPRVQNTSFHTYNFSSNQWSLTDKTGTKYYFGTSSDSRIDDSTNSSHVYRWYLDKIEDLNGNFVSYDYYKDSNQVYPQTIHYTGNGNDEGLYKIDFSRELRSDNFASYKAGFPIETNYRINKIDISVNNEVKRSYLLSYTTGNNTNRSLLYSIVESSKDSEGNLDSLPPSIFDYQSSARSWSENTNINVPVHFKWISGADSGVRVMDVNGDGLNDFVRAEDGYPKEIWLNNGNGWTQDTSINFPFYFNNGSHLDNGVRYADINGDGLVDLVLSRDDNSGPIKEVWLNNGNGWTQDFSLSFPVYFVDGNFRDLGSRFVDVNGDGLADIIVSKQITSGPATYQKEVWINNGNGWVQNTNYSIPFTITDISSNDVGSRIFDVNGDGLVDVVISRTDYSEVYINNGNGWFLNTSIAIPFKTGPGDYEGCRLSDVNGDNLTDMVCAKNWTGNVFVRKVWINNGNGFVQDPNIIIPVDFAELYSSAGSEIFDADGDGLDDILVAKHQGPNIYDKHYWQANGLKNDLLQKITNSTGSISSFEYKASALYSDGGVLLNEKLPLNIDTVSIILTNDGLGNVSTNQYSYEGGYYYYNNPFDKKFAGFHIVKEIDPIGSINKSYFHQGNDTDVILGEYSDSYSKIGQIYRQEKYSPSNVILQKNITKWDSYNLGVDRDFVKLANSISYIHGINPSTYKSTANSEVYDNTNGNEIEKIDWGEVNALNDGTFSDIGNDMTDLTTSYAINTSLNILGLPKQNIRIDQNGNKINETKFYYDSQILGGVFIGNLTKQSDWISGTDYRDTQKSYNSLGLVTDTYDALLNHTQYSYDQYSLYPEIITNPLSQQILYEYYYLVGKPVKVVDVNGQETYFVIDGFGRVLEERGGDGTTILNRNVLKKTYTYRDFIIPHSTTRIQYISPTLSNMSVIYTDGLGRNVQTKTQSETEYITQDYIYNNQGLLFKESLPYETDTEQYSKPTTNTNLITTYNYDYLGRINVVSDVSGSVSTLYNIFNKQITDQLGNIKEYNFDVNNNIVSVVEHEGSSIYTTNYSWNKNNNLIKITDTNGNYRKFTYDALGRRIVSEDLHDPLDRSFGVWQFTYDKTGNIIQKIDPKGQIINYTYDALGRILTEDFIGTPSNDVLYTYDTCINGVGRICQITMINGLNDVYDYTNTGLVNSEERTIKTIPYRTSYQYDFLGNKTNILYPDNTEILYTYNSGNHIEKVDYKDSSVPSGRTLISNFDYNPLGLMILRQNANGTNTTYTYNENNLYRLTNILTEDAMRQKIQDTAYTYDLVGNILALDDTSTTKSSRRADYTYDDLYRLKSADITSSNGNYTQTYTYDGLGNIITKSDNPGTYAYEGNILPNNYANPHTVTRVGALRTIPLTTYTYDMNGNLINSSSGFSNSFDYNNRITRTTTPTSVINYDYDFSGSRISYAVGSDETIYPNSLYNIKNGTDITKHVFVGNQAMMTIEDHGAGSVVYYDHTDNLSSSNVSTDDTGSVVQVLDYYPFGTIRINDKTSSFDEQKKYTGHQIDSDTEYTYMNARYYEGSRGQFISQDPEFWVTSEEWLFDPQSQNAYSYARNNPINLTDPTGRSAIGNLIKNIKSVWNNLWNGNTTSYQALAPIVVIQQPKVETSRTTTWDSVSDARIKQLDPRVQQPATNFINNTESELNTQLRVTQGYRSIAEQDKLYNQSRSNPPTGPWATSAKGGQSYHNYGMAIDIVIMENGKPNWNKPINQNIANIGAKQGFEWGGNWASPSTDYPHFQMTFGQSWQSLLKASKQ